MNVVVGVVVWIEGERRSEDKATGSKERKLRAEETPKASERKEKPRPMTAKPRTYRRRRGECGSQG